MKPLLYICLALLVSGPVWARGATYVARNHSGRIVRSPAAKHAFMKASPCPGGPDAGSTSRCRGYVVDHVKPLACAGVDAPSNMAWQTIEAGKAKDKIERKGC